MPPEQSKAFEAGLIGHGTIGREVADQVEESGGSLKFIARRQQVSTPDKLHELRGDPRSFREYPEADVVFLTIPTEDDGETARDYIQYFVSKGTAVVTCEKGALANYCAELASSLDRIGANAAVGGGSDMPHFLRRRMNEHVLNVFGVINGTTNFIMEGLSQGWTTDQMVMKGRALHITEPGQGSSLDVLNSEVVGDASKKAAVLFNYCFGEEPIRAKDFRTWKLSPDDLHQLEREAKELRFAVSFERLDSAFRPAPRIPVFQHQSERWLITGGFCETKRHPLFVQKMPRGVENVLLVSEASARLDGSDLVSGPGAGAEPTAAAMLRDAHRLLKTER